VGPVAAQGVCSAESERALPVNEAGSPIITVAANWWIAIFGAAVGLMSGLFSGLAGRRFEEWLYGPRLVVEFLPEEGGRTEGKWERDGTEVVEIYIRARVRNTRRRVAKQCRPYIVKLEEVQSSSTITTSFFDSLVLRWPGPYSQLSYVPRDIPNGVHQFFDIVGVFKHRPGWRFKWQERSSNLALLDSYAGTYRFTVLVTGDGVKPSGRKIDVYYDGKDWKTLRALDAGRFPPRPIFLRWIA